MLKRENAILREENKVLRNEIIRRTSKMEQSQLLELLGLQRLRIDNLEREYDALVAQMYDIKERNGRIESGAIDASQLGPIMELQEKLENSERKCKVLQE
jgi:hypothetical protein